MSYLTKCDICGKETTDDRDVFRIEIRFESTDSIVHDGVKHVCNDCIGDFRELLSVLQKRKEE